MNKFIPFDFFINMIGMPKVFEEYKELARKKIVEAAIEVFNEKGYYKTTMNDIGKKIGTSKGALYLYFPSKEDLFREIINQWQLNVQKMLSSAFENKNGSNGLENLFELILSDANDNFKLGFEFIAEAFRIESVKEVMKEYYSNNVEILSNLLNKQLSDNKSKHAIDTHSLSIAIFSLLIGLIGSLILDENEEKVKQTWSESIKIILSKS